MAFMNTVLTLMVLKIPGKDTLNSIPTRMMDREASLNEDRSSTSQITDYPKHNRIDALCCCCCCYRAYKHILTDVQ